MTSVTEPAAPPPAPPAPPAADLARARRYERRRRRRRQLAGQALLSPSTLWLAVFLVLPLGVILVYAVAGVRGGILGGTKVVSPTLDNFRDALSGNYPVTFLRATWFSLLVVAITLALGYPLAYFVVRFGGRRQSLLLVLVMIPFWTSYLARMYAWRTLFSNDGPLNRVLGWVSLGPVDWLGSPFAVVVVLAYSFLPFMILPVYVSVDRMDYRLVEASYDLGAGRASTFWRVTARQTLPGILGGSMLVFIPCVGDFATAQIIGLNSGRTRMIGQQIQGLFGKGSYPVGSALSMLLMVFIVVGMVVYLRTVGGREGGF